MSGDQADARARLAELTREIARQQGLAGSGRRQPLGAPRLDRALRGGLARGALHEILAAEAGDLGAAHGFALALAGRLAGKAGRVLWVQDEMAAIEDGAPYGPGLAMHGLDPERLVVVRVERARAALWALEQALRCRSLAAVVGEIAGLARVYDLTASRRLALAARESGATGLVVHAAAGGLGRRFVGAAATRWAVEAHPSRPGRAGEPGRPAWRIALVRHRGGGEGTWIVEWDHDARAFRDPETLHPETLPGAGLPPAGDGPPAPADGRRRA